MQGVVCIFKALVSFGHFIGTGKPGMLNEIRGSQSLKWISGEHFPYQVFDGIRDHHPDWFLELERGIHHIGQYFLILFSLKGWLPRQKNKQNYAHRPDITLVVVQFLENFRRYIVGLDYQMRYSSDSFPGLKLTGLKMNCASKVHNLQVLSLRVVNDILRLQVPMSQLKYRCIT